MPATDRIRCCWGAVGMDVKCPTTDQVEDGPEVVRKECCGNSQVQRENPRLRLVSLAACNMMHLRH